MNQQISGLILERHAGNASVGEVTSRLTLCRMSLQGVFENNLARFVYEKFHSWSIVEVRTCEPGTSLDDSL